MEDEFSVVQHNFKNMTVAHDTCSSLHEEESLPYFQCLCSGIVNARFLRLKYVYCKRAAEMEAEATSENMAEIGMIIGIVLAVFVFLGILIFIYRKFKPQIRERLAYIGARQHADACSRMFCFCCQKRPKAKLGEEPPPNQNVSGRPTSKCGQFFYSDKFLAAMEFICDCDCFRTRRSPRLVPILGRQKPKGRGAEASAEEPMVELQQPRRMRSVRKAPPPPAGAPRRQPNGPTAPPANLLPDAPAFDPELGPITKPGPSTPGKRRAPRVPSQSEPVPGPSYQPPPPAGTAYHPPYQYPPPGGAGPPRYQDLYLSRQDPLRASKEFNQELNRAMAGRRWPSESEI